ncbi:unnamed protein product [Symbiodinium natans]|uniref:Uncharacterized protein n=1 Tax=Symbiodinium natans TaxID=878477 RepID=A0A812JYQ3_9DINO|nr:unnamed protein product [Symbiodinium natans]
MAADDVMLENMLSSLVTGSGLPRPAPVCSAEHAVIPVGAGLQRPAPLVWGLFELPGPGDGRICAQSTLPSATSALSLLDGRCSKRARIASGPLTDCRDGDVSLRSKEDAERVSLCDKWADVAVVLLNESDLDVAPGEVSKAQLSRIFANRAASTLKKHLRGWGVWWEFCRTSSWSMARPSLTQLLDFFESLCEGVRMDRGRNRKSKAMGVIAAMKFAASRLQLCGLLGQLKSPLLEPWGRCEKWSKRRPREATPLSFDIVLRLELACQSAPVEDSWLLLCFLLMLFGSLRWSDAQRVDLSSVSCQQGCLRGWTWRCKQSATGMPWAVWCKGVANSNWGVQLFEESLAVRAAVPNRDFLIGHGGQPVSYSTALAQFRRCLVTYGGVDAVDVLSYTLHSLKCTFLSWAEEAEVSSRDRSAQGHHKEPGVSECVPKYGRNDTLPQLRCQKIVLDKLVTGWRPMVPVDRGVGGQVVLPADEGALSPAGSVTESESEHEDGEVDDSGSSVCPSDILCDQDSDAGSWDACDSVGPWIINGATGWFHLAVATESGGLLVDDTRWGLACRPRAVLQTSCFLVRDDPALQCYVCCGHSACAAQCGVPV